MKKAKRTTSRVVTAEPVKHVFDIQAPERRAVNFFVRVKKSNAAWAKAQAKAKGLNHSEYIDLLIDGLRAQKESHA